MRIVLFITSLFMSFSVCAELSLEQKIGQMLMVGFDGKGSDDSNVIALGQDIDAGKIGGVLFFARNIESPQQVLELVHFLKSFDSQKTFFAIDQEGGRVQRLKQANGFQDYISVKQVSETLSPELALSYYQNLATELSHFGFNLNLGPVVDLHFDHCPVIGKLNRSFHEDPNQVVEYAESFIQAHLDQKMNTCLKHFPGHGSSKEDTHLGLTDVTSLWTAEELLPYVQLKDKSNMAIMSSHIVNRNLDSEGWPACLSYSMIQTKLRDDLGFDGVVITDCLLMNAIWNEYSFEEIVKKAILAGNDVLLLGQYSQKQGKFPSEDEDLGFPERFQSCVLNLIEKGEIPVERIEESYNRIQKMKDQ